MRKSHSLLRPLAFVALAALLAFFASGCGLLSDSNDDGGGGNSGVTVIQAALGNAINEEQQLTGLVARAFPAETNHIYAVVLLQGVGVGAEVTGRWYQLSVQDAPPEGAFVSEAGVTLVEDNISEGVARVALDLGANAGVLPAGDWVLRVSVDGEFIRTMGFVITPQIAIGQAPSGQQPSPTAEAQPTVAPQPAEPTPVPEPQTYTIQPGDTLTIIAEQFRTPEEPVDAYIARLTEANGLAPGAIIAVGQVLQLPGPPGQ